MEYQFCRFGRYRVAFYDQRQEIGVFNDRTVCVRQRYWEVNHYIIREFRCPPQDSRRVFRIQLLGIVWISRAEQYVHSGDVLTRPQTSFDLGRRDLFLAKQIAKVLNRAMGMKIMLQASQV